MFSVLYTLFILSPHQTQVLELKNSRYSINRLFLTSKELVQPYKQILGYREIYIF